MPIYEYECPKCGKAVEVFQHIKDPAPICHGVAMKRFISNTSFILRGLGWYATDYKKKDKPENAPKTPIKKDK